MTNKERYGAAKPQPNTERERKPPRPKGTKFCRVLVSEANRTNLEARFRDEWCGSLRSPAPYVSCYVPRWCQKAYEDSPRNFFLKKQETAWQ
jgi:hypothetical protein